MIKKSFKETHSFDIRKSESSRILEKYPDRIPIIAELTKSSILGTLDKSKYLVPKDLTLGQFHYVIRKRLKLSDDKAIFFFINDKLFPMSKMLSEIFNTNKDLDGFLYITVSGESTFGNKN